MMGRIEAMPGVVGVILGRSYGGRSLASQAGTGALRVQRRVPGGLKAVTQSAKGLQELFIRIEAGREDEVARRLDEFLGRRS